MISAGVVGLPRVLRVAASHPLLAPPSRQKPVPTGTSLFASPASDGDAPSAARGARVG
ncbi:hypothetical protein [Streptoalloteichus hindustanus]|uniref:Uncharacterized protein n=1 Tax=Streptoalloteichus hindustanus TaxID=2017 RepID=A0A1M5M060_STRHI|nr:hypothetical protein [Streptoalloteichus hindustanus]SHG70063.1 hypothetical protein SAMN05444320_112107 [Streptoalloteichus hindustanus]